MNRLSPRSLLSTLLLLLLAAPSCTAFQQPAPLRLESRLVIEDVSVTDAKGKPVHNLPASAFHITDDKRPQTILDFRESVAAGAASQASGPAVYTNATLLQNQSTIVAILIDASTIELQDQLFLVVQIRRFLDVVAPGTQIAVFRANNQGIPVLLQGPTTDRDLLRRALTRALPVLTRPTYSNFQNSLAVLTNLADFFRAVPGNKALLWLSGRFPLYVPPSFQLNDNHNRAVEDDMLLQRTLQQARLAVYPIDVRGVLAGGFVPTHVIDTAAAALDPSTVGAPPTSDSAKIAGQYDAMDRLATSTGGTAFYSNNAVSTIMNSAIAQASSSYAIGYQPNGEPADDRWHTINITVDGPYTLRYRTGYYSAASTPVTAPAQRQVLNTRDTTAQGATSDLSSAAPSTGRPIIFTARISTPPDQTSLKSKTGRVSIRYVIPTGQLNFDSSGKATLRLAALAYNASGDVLSCNFQLVDTHFTPAQMQLAGRVGTPVDQTIELAHNAEFLLLAVEDLTTQNVGTIQLPVPFTHH